MTTCQIIACVSSWTAAIVAVAACVAARRAARRAAAPVWHVRLPIDPHGHAMLTSQKPLTEVEFEALTAAWKRLYGEGRVNHGKVIEDAAERTPVGTSDAGVCCVYQSPAAAGDSGFCARCGMSDFKHQGAP